MHLPIPARRLARHLLQVVLAIVSTLGAWLLTQESLPRGQGFFQWLTLAAIALPIRAVAYWPFGLYRSVWKYASIRELVAIASSVGIGSVIMAAITAVAGWNTVFSAAFFVVDALLLVFMLGAVRLPPRLTKERAGEAARRHVLIFGAGDAGAMILRDMLYRSDSQYEPVGVLDDDPAKHGLQIHGVRVAGGRDAIPSAMAQLQPDEVLVAIPSATLATLREIVNALQLFDVAIKTLPSIHELPECRVELRQIRPLAMEDLLTRPAVGLNDAAVLNLIAGRRVLVTGAGGSIGSELCRQLLRWQPEALILVERHENALFWLMNELGPLVTSPTRLVPALVDITHADGIAQVFNDNAPHVVFHAAAHKHVPLLEDHLKEAVRNNVLGTLIVARAAERAGVERFVLISTDKAVGPISVMGATKRLCELAVQTLMKHSRTRFCAVRFGNVLGSNGSVTQLFLRQIRAGGPVTVTDPEMRRYFMLISEAVQLVAHAATLAEHGTIYVLDMGEPIRIVDLARQLIRLAGCRPDIDIPIQVTGLRPGERLGESLVDETEQVDRCATKGLFRVVPGVLPDAAFLEQFFLQLERAVRSPTATLSLEELLEVIPSADGVDQRLTGTR